MKKLVILLIPLFILIFANSCTETPTQSPPQSLSGVENYTSAEIEDIYLAKSKIQKMEISLEEFTELVKKDLRMSKTITNFANGDPEGWISLGPETELLDMEDDESRLMDLGFDFTFFGQAVSYSEVYVNNNGSLSFGYPFELWDFVIPAGEATDDGNPREDEYGHTYTDVVGVLCADLKESGNVYQDVIGTTPNRIFVVTWEDVDIFGGGDPNGLSTFQVQLFESSNKIMFAYKSLITSGSDLWGRIDIGLSIGDFPDYVRVAKRDEILAYDGETICFTPETDGSYYSWVLGACAGTPTPPPLTYKERLEGAISDLDDIVLEEEFHKKKMTKVLEKAKKEIAKSLEDKNWLGDDPDPKHGKKVFDHIKHAVKELKKFEKSKDVGPNAKADAMVVIDDLINICKEMVEVPLAELEELYCDLGKCGREKDKALREIFKAEEEYSKRHWDKVIDKYKKAWEHIQKAFKHYEGP